MNEQNSLPYGMVEAGALGVKDGHIAWLGSMDDVPKHQAGTVHDCAGRWIMPGLVDCHTHLVFGGNRAKEFEMRLGGLSYADIAKAGGGILSTVMATRAASAQQLYETAARRLDLMKAQGVTTVEIKSGYGLDWPGEQKMLRVAARLADENVHVRKTFLGAHAVPPEYAQRADDYIDLICNEMIPKLAGEGLVDAVDGFCENIGFSVQQIERVFKTAKAHNLPVKLHAEQLSNQGGAKLAARYKALSADHLEHLDEAGVRAMAEAGTVAVLLPAAYYFLGGGKKPPIDLLRRHNIPMAVASDCNPGSAPITAPLMVLNMACTLFGLTPQEALAGMTRVGAQALGLDDRGVLDVGRWADLAVWDIGHPSELCYWMGSGYDMQRFIRGVAS